LINEKDEKKLRVRVINVEKMKNKSLSPLRTRISTSPSNIQKTKKEVIVSKAK
jgi:hypothetical protein